MLRVNLARCGTSVTVLGGGASSPSGLCVRVVGLVVLSEEDAVAQESKAGSAVHLPLGQFGLGVHALGASTVVFEGDSSGHGVGVLVDASGEGVDVW